MARDGRGKSPPGESSSFDLSKMSEAEVAAEMAKRMARFRDTHKRPDAAALAHDPDADAPSAQAEAAQAIPPRGLDPVAVTRLQRALKLNAQARASKPDRTKARSKRRASALGTEFKSLLAEGPNMNAIGMRPENPVQRAMERARVPEVKGEVEVDAPEAGVETRGEPAPAQARATGSTARSESVASWQARRPALPNGIRGARRQARAIGIVVRQAASDKFVIAGVFAIAAAIIVWLLIPVEHHAPQEIAHAPEATPSPAATPAPAPVITTAPEAAPPPAVTTVHTAAASSETARPPQQPAVAAHATDVASMPVPSSSKPESHAPHLVARLKPVISKPAKLKAKPKPNAQESGPSQQATENSRNPADPRTSERLLQ